MITWVLVGSAIGVASGGLGLFAYLSEKVLKDSYSKFSDAQLLALMSKLGTFNSKDIALHSPLNKNEAYLRLQVLSVSGVLKSLYDSNFAELYSLKDVVNLVNMPKILHELNEDDIIRIAQHHTGIISAVHLCIAADIPLSEAKKKMKFFKLKGIIETHYDNDLKKVHRVNLQKYVGITYNNNITQKSTKELGDASLIQLAIEMNGKLTSTSLCLKKNISVEEAKRALDNLYDKGVFDMRVNENGIIEYWLTDTDLLK